MTAALVSIEQIAVAVEQIVTAVVQDHGLPSEGVTQYSSLGDDLGMDGEDIHTIVIRCEERFKISIPDDAITEQSRVGDLIELVANLLRKKDAMDELIEMFSDFPEDSE